MRIRDTRYEGSTHFISALKSDFGFDVTDLCYLGFADTEDSEIPEDTCRCLAMARSIGLDVDTVYWGFPTAFDSRVGDSRSSIFVSSVDGILYLVRFLDTSDRVSLDSVAQTLFGESLDVDSSGNVCMEYSDLTYSYRLEGNLDEDIAVYYCGDDFSTAFDILSSL